MGVTYKMGADVSGFKQGMQQAQQSVKTLDAQLKLNEKQLKATGDAELYAANKSKLLNQQMAEQKKVVANIQKQLEDMKKRGVDEASDAYQKLERAMYNAAGKMMDIQAELNGLADSEGKVADGANEMAANLAGINKKVSFDAVITGVNKITDGIGKAIKGAINLGETLFDEFKDAAKWADDTATMAQMYEVPLDKLLKMQALVGNGMDTSVDAMLGGMQKLKKNVGKESQETMETLQKLGLATTQTIDTGFGKVEQTVKLYSNSDDLFWKAGRALMNMSDAFDKESAAQSLFGKSWRELVPLFSTYSSMEEYNKALEDVTTNSTEAVEALAESSDALAGLETSWQTLKYETLGAIAPALTEAAKVLQQLLDSVTKYLKTDEGQELLKSLGDAVGALFEDLSKIDPKDVVKNFVAVFDQLKNAFLWIKENWDAVKIGLAAIVGVFTAGKVVAGVNTFLNMINGIKELGGAKGVQDAVNAITNSGGTDVGTDAVKEFAKKSGKNGWVKDAIKTAGSIAIPVAIVYEATVGYQQSIDAWNEDAEARKEALDKQEQSFSGQSDPLMVDAWKYIRDHANDPGFLDDMAERYYKWYKSSDITSEYYDYEDPLWDAIQKAYDNDFISPETYRALVGSGEDLSAGLMGSINTKLRMQKQGYTGGWETYDLMETMNLLNQLEAELADAANDKNYVPEQEELNTQTEETTKDVTELGNSSDETGEFVRKLGEETDTATGHVTKFGELAGGAEHSVDALGGAAAAAAGALASIRAPSWATHANGIWDVPWDGYPAILHKGERVTPAREIAGRSFSSNLYVENMNMGGGMDADALAAAIAGRNRRMMAGYGS